MENRAHRNPVFAHLTRNTRWPTARVTLWLAAGLMLASLALTVFQMARVDELPLVGFHPIDILTIATWGLYIVMLLLVAVPVAAILTIATWGLYIVMPLVVAPVAAILTTRETQDEGFQLLRVTPGYSPGGAVRGLVLAALYRLRVLLVLMVALVPTVMVERYRGERWLAQVHCYTFVSREEWAEMDRDSATDAGDLTCIEPSDRRLLLKSFVILLWPVGLWGVTLFSAALAVWLALWWGRAGWVWAYLVGWPLCVVAALTLLGPVMGSIFTMGGSALDPYCETIALWPPPELDVAVPFSVMFYVLAWGVLRLARRWARSTRAS